MSLARQFSKGGTKGRKHTAPVTLVTPRNKKGSPKGVTHVTPVRMSDSEPKPEPKPTDALLRSGLVVRHAKPRLVEPERNNGVVTPDVTRGEIDALVKAVDELSEALAAANATIASQGSRLDALDRAFDALPLFSMAATTKTEFVAPTPHSNGGLLGGPGLEIAEFGNSVPGGTGPDLRDVVHAAAAKPKTDRAAYMREYRKAKKQAR